MSTSRQRSQSFNELQSPDQPQRHRSKSESNPPSHSDTLLSDSTTEESTSIIDDLNAQSEEDELLPSTEENNQYIEPDFRAPRKTIQEQSVNSPEDYHDLLQSLSMQRQDFSEHLRAYGKAIAQISPDKLSAAQQDALAYAKQMTENVREIYNEESSYLADRDYARLILGLDVSLTATQDPANTDNIEKLAYLYNDTEERDVFGCYSFSGTVSGIVMICIGACLTIGFGALALASSGALSPAALTGMGFAGTLITKGLAALGGAASAKAGLAIGSGLGFGAFFGITGSVMTRQSVESGFARTCHGLFDSLTSKTGLDKSAEYDWGSELYNSRPALADEDVIKLMG